MERKLQRSNSKMERWRVAARKVLFSLHDEQLPAGNGNWGYQPISEGGSVPVVRLCPMSPTALYDLTAMA
ncbi:hypothetical protein FJT64_012269 [Amphibalanus amphitrite]|uniref:Uncharacterized protein n=1 Tax=Amphibalanus amphitrite TaxID=1232801 RepID=A0A6A4VE41_AMPAM|nr:hypothetical protein FJT64_012269 [Amphibalanus amphitrite]